MSKCFNRWWIPLSSAIVIIAFALILIIPVSRNAFQNISDSHPYVMGFIKFGLLATVGELLSTSLRAKCWTAPVYVPARIVIWGIIGIWITYMMKIYPNGVSALMTSGLLPGENSVFLRALFTSITMNLTFGPTFMAVHKCTDKWLELRAEKKGKVGLCNIITGIDWYGFVSFTLFKTVPLFWIPAHTITFLLPSSYQVIMAASLSVALGIFLSLKK